MKNQKKGTPEYRTARALIKRLLPNHTLEDICKAHDITVSGWGKLQADDDLELLEEGARLLARSRTLAHYDDEVAIEAVKFILSENSRRSSATPKGKIKN